MASFLGLHQKRLRAIYLDKGFEVSKSFILKLWKNLINDAETTFIDAKTQLQEYSLKNFKLLPIYKLVSNSKT